MKLFNTLLLTSCCLILIACGDKSVDSLAADSLKLSKTKQPKMTNPFANQLDALEKAKNLEGQMNKAVQDKLKAIDEMSK